MCTTVGSIPGQDNVDGNRFVQLSYGYSRSKLWEDFGITLAFFFGFFALLLIFTEKNTASASDTAATLFKRGSRAHVTESSSSADEEKGQVSTQAPSRDESPEKTEKALEATPEMTDIFSWQNLRYTVPIGKGETRLLLDDVSGYVAPGKLTALM